mmetsp:Transcript_10004/g.19380  ORF Transcript_10004/g.19380 Transcript_10004/m.19380 type:complete len:287 (-) Transcript_10004:426-1286(-)
MRCKYSFKIEQPAHRRGCNLLILICLLKELIHVQRVREERGPSPAQQLQKRRNDNVRVLRHQQGRPIAGKFGSLTGRPHDCLGSLSSSWEAESRRDHLCNLCGKRCRRDVHRVLALQVTQLVCDDGLELCRIHQFDQGGVDGNEGALALESNCVSIWSGVLDHIELRHEPDVEDLTSLHEERVDFRHLPLGDFHGRGQHLEGKEGLHHTEAETDCRLQRSRSLQLTHQLCVSRMLKPFGSQKREFDSFLPSLLLILVCFGRRCLRLNCRCRHHRYSFELHRAALGV